MQPTPTVATRWLLWVSLLSVGVLVAHTAEHRPAPEHRPTPSTAAPPRKWINSFAGPYIIVVTRTYMCEEESYEPLVLARLLVSRWDARKPLELQRVDGNVTIKTTITDDQWVYVSVDKRNNNEWKPNAFIVSFAKGGCSVMRRLFPDTMRRFFGEQKGPCGFYTGEYSLRKQPVDWTVPDVPILPYAYAQYRLNATCAWATPRRWPPGGPSSASSSRASRTRGSNTPVV